MTSQGTAEYECTIMQPLCPLPKSDLCPKKPATSTDDFQVCSHDTVTAQPSKV